MTQISTVFFFLMIRRPPRSTLDRSSAASDVYKRQILLHKVVRRLKPHYQTLVELRYFNEYSYEEIAKELKLPLGTVKAQLFSCLLYTSPSPRDRTRYRMPSSA